MIQERIRLKLRFRTNVRSHLRWFQFLLSKEFYDDITRRFETVANVQRLKMVVEKVIDEEIYSVATSSPRTGDLLRSITGVAGTEDGSAGITVYFDPGVAAAVGPINGGDPGALNYAAFFDRPEFNSFLLGSGIDVFNPIKYRPFSEPMEAGFKQESEEEAIRAVVRSVKFLRPKQKKATAE